VTGCRTGPWSGSRVVPYGSDHPVHIGEEDRTGLIANTFVDVMISADVLEPITEKRNNLKIRNERK
jgi:hypothetical protein